MPGALKTKNELMKDIQVATFEMVETNLYLDTHPTDTEALSALQKYQAKRASAIAEYEEAYGPIFPFSTTNNSSKGYTWVSQPFPWEMED